MAERGPAGPVRGVLPRPPRFSLRAASDLLGLSDPTDEPLRVETVGWTPLCPTGGNVDPCGGASKTITETPGPRTEQPWGVWVGEECTLQQSRALDFPARLTAALDAMTDFGIESEFWAGTLATANSWPNVFLAKSGWDHNTASLTPTLGLAALEMFLTDMGGSRGMIHASRRLVTVWASLNLVMPDPAEPRLLVTKLGTVVIPGVGYPTGTVSGGPAGGETAFATDLVAVRTSPVEVIPGDPVAGTDRATNDLSIRAERLVSTTFDACRRSVVGITV